MDKQKQRELCAEFEGLTLDVRPDTLDWWWFDAKGKPKYPRDSYHPDQKDPASIVRANELLKQAQAEAYLIDFYWLKSTNKWNVTLYLRGPFGPYSATAETWNSALVEAVAELQVERSKK